MDLGGCERFEGGKVERFGEGIDTRVLQELVASFVDGWGGGVMLEVARAGDLAWEVVAGVEEFEEAAYGVQVFVNEVNATFLWSID